MTELFQYYYNDFKYVYLKNIPKETIASKSLVFGSVLHNYELFYTNPNTKNSVYVPLDKIYRIFNCVNSMNVFHTKIENSNELSVFDSLELYSIMRDLLTNEIICTWDLGNFVKQKHKEHINVPLELINDMIYKYYLDFKFPINIDRSIKTYLDKKYRCNEICVLIDFGCNNLSYVPNKRQSKNKKNSILTEEISATIEQLFSSEFYKCSYCGKYYDASCMQIDSYLCYYCHYKIYNTYPDGKKLLDNLINKIHFDDDTFIEVIKDAFIKHFITYFDIENDLIKDNYDELIKNKDFLNKIYNLNLYKNLFMNLLINSIKGEYNEYTLKLLEDFNGM